MNNVFYLIIVLLSITGCKSPIINNKDICSIIVENYSTSQTQTITDCSQINKLLRIINSSKQELFKFQPDYSVTILYGNNEKKVLLLKGQCIKIDGVTYRTSKKMSVMLDKLFETV